MLRRFAFSVEFRPLGRRGRMGMWHHLLRETRAASCFSAPEVQALSAAYPLSTGEIAAALQAARLCADGSAGAFKKGLQLSLDACMPLKKNRGWRVPDRTADEEEAYTTEGLNLDVEVEVLRHRLRRFDEILRRGMARPRNLNRLFSGPPGTGKSALARHLAAELGGEIHCRRYSDLQSKCVGEGEQPIRDAFEEAQRSEAVLLVDEVDSMLIDRDLARRTWEVTFVNEFLAQMETFRGILICTTNRMQEPDAAAIRRFALTVRFDSLTAEGNCIFISQSPCAPCLETAGLGRRSRAASPPPSHAGGFRPGAGSLCPGRRRRPGPGSLDPRARGRVPPEKGKIPEARDRPLDEPPGSGSQASRRSSDGSDALDAFLGRAGRRRGLGLVEAARLASRGREHLVGGIACAFEVHRAAPVGEALVPGDGVVTTAAAVETRGGHSHLQARDEQGRIVLDRKRAKKALELLEHGAEDLLGTAVGMRPDQVF